MSKYNQYAKDLDALVRKTRDSYKAALTNLEKAREKYKKQIDDTKNGTYSNASNAKIQAMQVLALEDLRAQESEYSRVCQGIEAEYRTRAAAIASGLSAQIESDNALRASGVDQGALALLASGLMTVNDFAVMAGDFAENPTMLKLVKKHLEKLNPTDAADRQRQSMLISELSSGSIERSFERLMDVADTYIGVKSGKFSDAHASAYVTEMHGHWDDPEVQAAINEF